MATSGTQIDPATGLPFNLNNPLLQPGSNLPPIVPTQPTSPNNPLVGGIGGTGGNNAPPTGSPAGPPAQNPDGSVTNPDGSTVFPGLTLTPGQGNSTGGILPASGVFSLTWLEELAIRIMLLIVGVVLITGGFKIAAARGFGSAATPAQLAARAGLPVNALRKVAR
jgi:hypothetical protein